MPHLAIIAPPFTSHVRALEALADALCERGHRVSWLHQADVGALIRSSHIEFHALGTATHPAGSLDAVVARAARPGGPSGLRRVIRDVATTTDMLCREAPARLRALGVDAIVADQMEAAGGLVAAHLGLPFVSVACALPVDREPRIPLPVMPWGYERSEKALHRNAISARVYDRLMRAHAVAIEAQCRRWRLPLRRRLDECLSPTLQLSQTPAGFDFPRAALPAGFHAVGPLRPRRPPARADRLVVEPAPGAPFVFVSLGTLQGGRFRLLRRIVQACRAVGVQSLVAHCGGLDARQAAALGATWVTDYADQPAALARADAVVTHAGLNTVLDAAAAGVPALALPIAFDQPGVAARLVHAGAGLRASYRWARAGTLARALARLLAEPAFAQAAARIGAELPAAGGVVRAADLIEAMPLSA